MKQKPGFTLLELLVVIVIISVMAGLLIPSLVNNNRQPINSAEELVLLINMAQHEAIMSSRVWQLVFETEQDQYRFQQLGGAEFEEVTIKPLAGIHPMDYVALEDLEINGQSISSDIAEVYLYPTGEQDSLRLVFTSGINQYVIAMGVIGPARLEEM